MSRGTVQKACGVAWKSWVQISVTTAEWTILENCFISLSFSFHNKNIFTLQVVQVNNVSYIIPQSALKEFDKYLFSSCCMYVYVLGEIRRNAREMCGQMVRKVKGLL